MFIKSVKLNRTYLLCALCLIIAALILAPWITPGTTAGQTPEPALSMGGAVLATYRPASGALSAALTDEEDDSERFQRPSKKAALPNPYAFGDFEDNPSPPAMKTPEDPIYAYFGILKEASNMSGYSGGCGTVGQATLPYPYAYRLLTEEARAGMSLAQFTESFQGTGHMTLLTLIPLPAPPGAPEDERYYLIEIEVITGPKAETDADYVNLSYFTYYDGVVTVKRAGDAWAIQKIDYYPEGFLCAPYHGWWYYAEAVVQIVFQENLKIIDRITGQEEKDGVIQILATGPKGEYRFDFVRLQNGWDTLIGEYYRKDGAWMPVELLTDGWKNLKLSPTVSGKTGDLEEAARTGAY